MNRVNQGAHTGGCAHQAQGGSASVLIAGGRAAQIVSPGLDFANEAAGVGQVRDRLLCCERVRDQLERIDAGVIEAVEQLAQGLVQGLDRSLADTLRCRKTQGQVLD